MKWHKSILIGLLITGGGACSSKGDLPGAAPVATLAKQAGGSERVAISNLSKAATADGTSYAFNLDIDNKSYAVTTTVNAAGDRVTLTSRPAATTTNEMYLIDIEASPTTQWVHTTYSRDGLERQLGQTESNLAGLSTDSDSILNQQIPDFTGELSDQGIHREALWALQHLWRGDDERLRLPLLVALSKSSILQNVHSPTADSFDLALAHFQTAPLQSGARANPQATNCYDGCADSVSTFNAQVAHALAGWPNVITIEASGPQVSGTSTCRGTCGVEASAKGELNDHTYKITEGDECWNAGYKPPDYDKIYTVFGEVGAYATNPSGCIPDGAQDHALLAKMTLSVFGNPVFTSVVGMQDIDLSKSMMAYLSSNVVTCFNSTNGMKNGKTTSQKYEFKSGTPDMQTDPCAK